MDPLVDGTTWPVSALLHQLACALIRQFTAVEEVKTKSQTVCTEIRHQAVERTLGNMKTN